MEFDDLMCASEIAQLLSVSRQRISQLYQRKKLPKPLGKKGETVLWLKSDIIAWNTERMKKYRQTYFPAEYTPFTKQTEIITPREMEVLIRYVNRRKNIAEELGMEKSTVATTVQHIKKRLGVTSAKELAEKALELGIISDEPAILSNKIRCTHCGDIIESTHVHDFKTCSCGRVSVDGGHEYLRRVFKEDGDFEELSTFEEIKQ